MRILLWRRSNPHFDGVPIDYKNIRKTALDPVLPELCMIGKSQFLSILKKYTGIYSSSSTPELSCLEVVQCYGFPHTMR